MAKTLKKIICPQCGSNKIKELKDDYYKCESCQTNFFLDSDDININHKYTYNDSYDPNAEKNKKAAIKFVIIFLAVILVLSFIGPIISVISSSKSKNTTIVEPVQEIVPPKKEVKMVPMSIKANTLYRLKENKVTLVQVATTNDFFAKRDKVRLFLILNDVITGEELSRKPIDVDLSLKGVGLMTDFSVEFFKISDRDLYLIVNNYHLLKFNDVLQCFEKVDEELFRSHKEFSEGIAGLKYNTFDEGIEVTNNLGKKFMYYIYLNKVYSSDEVYKVYDLPLPNGVKKTGYLFTRKSFDYPDEARQLIQYDYWYQEGYPMYYFYFEWRRDYGGSGVFSSSSPHKKVLILDYTRKKARIGKVRDFTPNRKYAVGTVVGSDEEGVIIAIKQSILENETYSLQKLSSKDGSILWTKKTEMKGFRNVEMIDGVFKVGVDYNVFQIFDTKGEVLSTIDQSNLKTPVEEKE
ncbi:MULTISPECIES: hypothetical protein [Myroides]|uniref:Uncharacterized protein n=1 Tax=Myroides albus TaxID=2562892 RepID=A0A6I3LIJ5_9FLAO|nr:MULTISPECIES: hypothetical protein [Myroides]MTG98388.1 hypothetical protein [Myroides albus]MVX35739.1 hypothetical protein [Myroides sp. LoEW2-1]UVD80381.1 hypothetical protein NWE55_03675 [Myroides albus]